ncbi:hypothetical protein ACFY8X_39090 [Streptomyces tanashiensis]|uniref:hypothetical protein n=1 Tax=Streptomyces tanashiensis TaxID=67367 RepID=UPI0036EA0A9F
MTAISRDQAQDAMAQILAATAADKDTADQYGGDPVLNAAYAAATELDRIVHARLDEQPAPRT